VDGTLAVALTAVITLLSLLLHSALRRIPGNPLFARPLPRRRGCQVQQ
jgi:hypothetical protein